MSIFDIFEKLSAVSGKKDKAAILVGATPEQVQMFTWAMDPARVYFVTVDEENLPPFVGGVPETELFSTLNRLLYRLQTRTITGVSAKLQAQNILALVSTPVQQKWIARIINKDLRVGVDSQFRDAWPHAYKVFEPQLSKAWEGQDIEGWFYEDKWNGLRALAVPGAANVHGWFSRDGKAIPGMDHISEELVAATMVKGKQYVFDGEGFGGDWDDQVGQSVSKIRGNKAHDDITFNVFDMIEAEQWSAMTADKRKFKTEPFRVRRALLEEFFKLNPQLKKLKLVRQGVIDSANGMTPMAARDEAISRRLEGIIIKNPEGSYTPGKHSNGWYKYKKRNPADVTIIGAVEGTKAAKGMLGAILVKGSVETFDKDGKSLGFIDIEPSEIGTGFSRAQRIAMWLEWQAGTLTGQTVEIEWGEITKDRKLFHTAFKRRRFDK